MRSFCASRSGDGGRDDARGSLSGGTCRGDGADFAAGGEIRKAEKVIGGERRETGTALIAFCNYTAVDAW